MMGVEKALFASAGTFLLAVCLTGNTGPSFGAALAAAAGQTTDQQSQPASPSNASSSTPASSVSEPSKETSGTIASPAGASNASPQQARAVLDQLFLAESRIKDLLSTLKTSSWKMTDAERQQIDQSISSAQQKIQDLEKWRYEYYYHLKDVAAQRKTEAAVQGLEPLVTSIGAAAGRYQGAITIGQFQRASRQLASVGDQLQRQVGGPEAREQEAAPPAGTASNAETKPQASPPAPVAAPVAAKPTEVTPAAASTAPAAPPEVSKPVEANPPEAAPTASPAPPSTVPASPSMTPEQAKAVLDKLYLSESRIKDLLGTLQTTSWKATDTERQEVDHSISSAQQKLQDLERWRYQFYYHLDNLADGQKTEEGAESLQPVVAAIASAAAQNQGATTGTQLQQASEELASIGDRLKPYVSQMQARMKELLTPTTSVPSGGAALETEVIKPQPQIRPLSSIVTQAPPLSAEQVKQLLYKVYVPAFRIKDLLSQEQPAKWKASQAEINAFNASRQELLQSLATLEHWRELLSERPADLNTGFQAYVAIDRVLEPLEGVTLRVARYETARMAANYEKPASDLRTDQNDLLPYLTFLFRNHDQISEVYQTDLANCQNTLGYAMHGLRPHATYMKNVLPQFQGRNVRRREEAKRLADAKHPTSKKKASSRHTRRRRHHTTHRAPAAKK
jgi:hypothetical protein